MTKTQARKDKRRARARARVRILFFAMLATGFAMTQKSSVRTVAVSSSQIFPASVYAPMGFMLQASSPCIGKGTPIPGVTTDFFGLPVDSVHPSIGAVEYHEATPDYIALVRKILEERYRATPSGQAEIDVLFVKVYGRAR